jgi:uncharacterized protein YkwD
MMPLTRPVRIGQLLAVLASVAALMLIWNMTGGGQNALALTNCSVSDLTFDAEEKEFLRLINEYRARNGLGALTASVNLKRAASWMARDMAVNNRFSHTDSLGRSPSTRVAQCDGEPDNGENIAAGTVKDTAAEAFEMWRNSPGHNENMLYADYRQIGIARYYDADARYSWYWATEFSTSDDGTNAAGSSSRNDSPPARTEQPVISTTAEMTSPANGSTLANSQRFTWSPVDNAVGYFFYMGTSPGANDLVGVSMSTSTALIVNGIPDTGQTVYVRLWTETSSGWEYNDYTYSFPD